MARPKVNTTITGAISRPPLDTDGISGFPFYNDNIADLTSFTTTNRIIKFTSLASVEATGINSLATNVNFKEEYNLCKQFFAEGGTFLWIGIFPLTANVGDFAEILQMDTVSNGEIKLYGVYRPQLALTVTDVAKVEVKMVALEALGHNAHAFYGADSAAFTSLADFPNMRNLASECPRVSVVIGQDTENEGLSLSTASGTAIPYVGTALGAKSFSRVQQNIMNPGNFNYTDGITLVVPGFFINDAVLPVNSTSISSGDLDLLNDKGYLFWHYRGISGTYLSNDNNSAKITNTFNSIHIMTVRNKASREINLALEPLLGSNLLYNEDSTLKPISIKIYEDAVGSVLNRMKLNNEISNFDIFIDPAQKSLETKTVIIDVAIQPSETGDNINLNITFVSQL